MNPTDEHTTLAAAPAFEVSAEVLATLTEIGEEVNASLDLDEVLARTAALIKRHIDYEIFGVLMFEGDGSYLKFRFAIGYPRELADNMRIPVGQGITGAAAATGHSVRVADTLSDSRYINAIENVWSLLKRSLIGAHHKVSAKHLPAYLNEVAFRFNNRSNDDLFRDTMQNLLLSEHVTFQQLAA